MPRSLPPLNALRAFEAAGRHQSFSRAAEELGVSHSAISRHVRGLEARLNTHLFRPVARGIVLTTEGEAYLTRITPAFDLIDEATEAFAPRAAGRVVVNAEPVFASNWLIPRLKGFYQANPEVELILDASENLADVSRFEADMAIRFVTAGLPSGASTLLSNAPMFPYAAPSLAKVLPSQPNEFLKHRLLQDRDGPMWQTWFAQAGADPAQVPKYTHRMRAFLAVEAALAGHGVLLTSCDVMQSSIDAGRIVQCSDVPVFHGSYHLVFGDGVLRRRSVRAFRDWILGESAEFRYAHDPSQTMKSQPNG